MIGGMIGVPARASLSDDGIRSWSQEIRESLDEKYPGWQAPQETIMVPPVLPCKKDPGLLAEKKVFDLLKQMGNSEVDGKKEPMFVIHGHQFSELRDEVPDLGAHASAKKWLVGEHDIVVLHQKFGVIFMQVKAGKKIEDYKNAGKQLLKDKQALAANLKKHFGSGKLRKESAKAQFDYPGFVVMPNCPKATSNGKAGIFKEDCESVAAFKVWWDKNVKMETSTEGFTQEIYQHLVERLVGWSCKNTCLSEYIAETNDTLNRYTNEQWDVLQGTSSKQWITGPAGSGKTYLLKRKVVQLATKCLSHSDEGMKILVLCYNRPLAQDLEGQLQSELKDLLEQQSDTDLSSIIDVMTYDKFVNSNIGSTNNLKDYQKKALISEQYERLQRNAPCTYRHIFVDEGQDMYGIKWPELLELFLQKYEDEDDSLDPHYFWVMYDSNQDVQPSAENPQCFKKQLRDSSRLTRVMRNTGNIFDVSMPHYNSILCPVIELGHHVTGLDVEWIDSLPDETEAKMEKGSTLVAKCIQDLLKEKVQPNYICILTTEIETRDKLSEQLSKRGVACQNAEDHISTGRQCVIVESIRRFKGLESKVVILFDPTTTKTRAQLKALLYSAITRCFCLLIIISTKNGCKLIRPNTTETLSSPSRKRPLKETSVATQGKRPTI